MTVFNQEFEYSLNHRAGSMNDVEYLTSTFKKFGIVPSLKLDLKYKDIVKEIDGCKLNKSVPQMRTSKC